MKFTDIHTSLNKDVDLKRFHPNVKIEVESFNYSQKKMDVADNLVQTIDFSGNKNILVKPLSKKQKPFDSVFQEKKSLITFSPKLKKRFKLWYIKSKLIHFWELIKSLSNKSKIFKYVSIIVLIFFLVFFDKFLVEYNTNSGYKKLISLTQSNNDKTINSRINSAHSNFIIAKILFTPFRIIPNKQVENAHLLIKWWEEITTVLKKNIVFWNSVAKLIQEKWWDNIMFSQLLLNNKSIFINLEKDISNIEDIYWKIDLNPEQIELKLKLNTFKEKLKQAKFYVYTLNNNFDTFLEILGHSKRKKYLIAFQNNDEIRPNWGFMWSLWVVDIFRGQVKEFEQNDVYFYEFKIKKEHFQKERAPEGINKMTPYFGLRDSNYYINHKDSGDKIKYFMKKAGHSIDGIIYINMNTLSKILDLVWEFESKVLNQKVNSSNFSTIMSLLVESKISQKGTTWTPKQVLFDFMKEFQELLKQKNISQTSLIKIFSQDISNRDITLYNFDKKQRWLMKSLSLYNPIDYFSSLDFSYPVFTSISWNKSDRYIKHSYKKSITKWTDCSFHTTLTIQNQHRYWKTQQNYLEKLISQYWITDDINKFLFIQWNWLSKHYVRVIIPKQAKIVNKNVSVIDYKDRWQSVNFYLNTLVWEQSEFKLEYYLPNKECKTYNYKFYKQPWIQDYNIEINKFWEEFQYLNNKSDVYVN